MAESIILCLRCNTKMRFIKTEDIQLGKTGFFFRDLSNLVAGSLQVDIYICPKCKKIEFFSAEDNREDFDEEDFSQEQYSEYEERQDVDYPDFPFYTPKSDEDLPQVQCPKCGEWHDFDYPKCPFCKHKYED